MNKYEKNNEGLFEYHYDEELSFDADYMKKKRELHNNRVMSAFDESWHNNKRRSGRGGMQLGIAIGVFIASAFFLIGSIFINGSVWSFNNGATLTASSDPDALPDAVFNKKLETIADLIDDRFIFEYKKSQIQDGVLKGLIESLNDPYSQYYTASEFQTAMDQFNGSYSGIGVVVKLTEDKRAIEILNVYEGSPAEKSGLKAGDMITEVNGEEILPSTPLETTLSYVKGKKGTYVNLTIVRGTGAPKEYRVMRDEISTVTVSSKLLEPTIGYIRIHEFSSHTADEFDKAYKALVSKGVKKLVLDVRDNPGGAVSAVCSIMDGFLSEGTIIYTENKLKEREYIKADGAVAYKLPIAVLINGNTASAAEILSGTVRDMKLGKLIGENTYGKGIVQDTIPFSDGTAVKLTISRYYTASGTEIHGKGIAPDIKVIYRQPNVTGDRELTYKDDNQVMRAIKELKSK